MAQRARCGGVYPSGLKKGTVMPVDYMELGSGERMALQALMLCDGLRELREIRARG